jgi:hypothetical protein
MRIHKNDSSLIDANPHRGHQLEVCVELLEAVNSPQSRPSPRAARLYRGPRRRPLVAPQGRPPVATRGRRGLYQRRPPSGPCQHHGSRLLLSYTLRPHAVGSTPPPSNEMQSYMSHVYWRLLLFQQGMNPLLKEGNHCFSLEKTTENIG